MAVFLQMFELGLCGEARNNYRLIITHLNYVFLYVGTNCDYIHVSLRRHVSA
jgi:hypothetical protein